MSQETGRYGPQAGQLLGRRGLAELLGGCAPPPGRPASSAYIRPGEAQRFLGASGAEGAAWWERLRRAKRTLLTSDTGIVALRAGCQALVIVPPFPLSETFLVPTWDVSSLLTQLEAEYTIGVVLLRLGRFSVAVYEGEKLLSSKTDARYVKGRHHAGGTSQKRFQRIREGQVQRLYDKTCQAAQAQFGPVSDRLDYVLLGGDRFTLDGFLKACPCMERWRDKTLARRLNVRDPKRDTLQGVAGMLNESRVYPLEW